MKKLKLYTLLSIVALTPLVFIGCDGSPGGVDETDITDLQQEVVRGLDPAEIANNPDGTPGFPFTLSVGETIDFVPDFVDEGTFIAQVPLGTLIAENSGFIRHSGGGATGNLHFPVTEESFKLFYVTSSNSEPSTVSTQSEAAIEYSFEHRYTRTADFVPRLEQIYNSSSAPGSLQHAIINGGVVSDKFRTIIDAISSIGIAAVDHPGQTFFDGVAGPSARRFRQIILTGITSTNADLAGDNPIITGSYTLTDTWQKIVINDEGPVSLEHFHINGAHAGDITFTEISTGTFIINLDALTQTP
jgi:hypothetical protein